MIPNLIQKNRKLLTLNAVPGIAQFNENLKNIDGKEYREWDPKRSKLAAAIVKGVKNLGIKENSTILYLGAAHGYTCSFLSDIAKNGKIYALDFAPRVVRDLVYLAEKRKNICPILGDANKPESYFSKIGQLVDIVFMDIAQKNQTEIFLKNTRLFLKKEGTGLLALKARSIDVASKPEKIFKQARKELEQLKVIEQKNLNPFERDHCFFVVRK
ncbi:fibrillarin-like rRNA/tRNA 2'-O-methyltransferase [Candidatus Woesearchaeota archaeon]|nr:fibrillarin-like rRNA/tRNA 2'-O-methyltransferase [Candidatus Woesearchaeota archaeon]